MHYLNRRTRPVFISLKTLKLIRNLKKVWVVLVNGKICSDDLKGSRPIEAKSSSIEETKN